MGVLNSEISVVLSVVEIKDTDMANVRLKTFSVAQIRRVTIEQWIVGPSPTWPNERRRGYKNPVYHWLQTDVAKQVAERPYKPSLLVLREADECGQ